MKLEAGCQLHPTWVVGGCGDFGVEGGWCMVHVGWTLFDVLSAIQPHTGDCQFGMHVPWTCMQHEHILRAQSGAISATRELCIFK